MRRIAVVGPGGAGKSVLATRLGAELGIPVTHLDVLYWRANWEPAPREEAVARTACGGSLAIRSEIGPRSWV